MTDSPIDLARSKLDNAAAQSWGAINEEVKFIERLMKLKASGLYGLGGFAGGYTLSAIVCSIYHPTYALSIMAGTAVAAAVGSVRLSYTSSDLDQREYESLIPEARRMRDAELAALDQQIDKTSIRQSDIKPLVDRRNALATASNLELLKWAFPLSKIAKDVTIKSLDHIPT